MRASTQSTQGLDPCISQTPVINALCVLYSSLWVVFSPSMYDLNPPSYRLVQAEVLFVESMSILLYLALL